MSEVKGTKALELWCKRLVRNCPNVQIDNMTTSWRNGMAFCALVHHFRPDLIDMSQLNPENIFENNQLAYSIAEKHLGIPALLDPEDMVESEVPDRLSVLTYLSQFYQRLGHTVNTKASDIESKSSSSSSLPHVTTPIKFGKVALDKCAVCGLPVYLAQRLIVSQKLYHRQCFRCSNCAGHLNPKNYHIINDIQFSCDSCKTDKSAIPKYLNNNDQIGMLAFSSDSHSPSRAAKKEDIIVNVKDKPRPQSIMEKISMFEKNIEKDSSIESKISNISIKCNSNISDCKNKENEVDTGSSASAQPENITVEVEEKNSNFFNEDKTPIMYNDTSLPNSPEKVYKSNTEKLSFLQTQLSGEVNDIDDNTKINCVNDISEEKVGHNDGNGCVKNNTIEDINEKHDKNIEQSNIITSKEIEEIPARINSHDLTSNNHEQKINVPPRRKKISNEQKSKIVLEENMSAEKANDYPVHLNPFSDDEEEEEITNNGTPKKTISTNPFGSSDDEEIDEVPPIPPPPVNYSNNIPTATPVKRHITAYNPFWSDGEEESTDDESDRRSSLTTSTPNLPASTPRRWKPKAPPPPIIVVDEAVLPANSMDDVASISSFSSHASTIHSDQKSYGKCTPTFKKKRPAPTPPDSLSASGHGDLMEKGVDTSGARSNTSDGSRKAKGPAPGLPLPERREVKLQMSPEQLQVQLDLLETQQLGLERQGVLIEQMIRDKCDEATVAPQEEIEDLVIQLCELVNEKNDLFRKQTELMFIRRQQRLEQEQADIEHEIRVLQSRPSINRTDADKSREEHLVCRLVEIVRLRDELVQQIDAERRRERQEDLAIAASIASKRAQRNSDSNSSSIKSSDVVAPVKKNKVKDKVKKQLKKAKHSLISKKKDEDKKQNK
ncbi:MICAL-like protein 1 isoform X2 [Leptidea sinapis]|uniref:MICAL-like protein 1 isoform X2 n=1 Tax=Leptidea sinapis TaxID=189913 RepID=UPI0021C2A8AA|nr:MICAL-like protein 1 isoform X2 [Leptidea sinapis]